MSTRVIDLSKPIQYNRHDPFFMRVRVRHKQHWQGRWLVRLLGLPRRLMPRDFVGWADDTITRMGVHSTTHIDAPWHYGPESAGKRAATIDELPLDKCIGPGVVIDMTHKGDGEIISVADLQGADIERGVPGTGHDRSYSYRTGLLHRDIGVLEARHRHERRGDRMVDRPGCDRDGHRPMGLGRTLPASNFAVEAREPPRYLLGGARVGQRKPYWHMEQLNNLGALPAHGFKVCVFPLKLAGASAAPARVVALMESQSNDD